MDPGSEELRSFYAAHRALVRAKVALIAAAEHQSDARADQLAQAQALWTLGERLCWRARAPVAVVVCGPAASGKSTLAAELSRCSDMPVVSSDACASRRSGSRRPSERAPSSTSERFTQWTYELLGREAQGVLDRGCGVIVDATCRSRRDRLPLLHSLKRAGLTLLVVRCDLPLAVAIERAAARMHDARSVSDATPEIVAEQYRSFQGLEELPAESVLALDTRQSLDDQVAAVAGAADRLLARRGDSPECRPSVDAIRAPIGAPVLEHPSR